LPYQQLKSQFSGTGDVFSSITFGRYIQGYDLETSVQNAMDYVSKVIRENVSYGRPDNGIPIELHLSEL
jgi:pyridoxal/pyridoxine/pyridoxamine kinase